MLILSLKPGHDGSVAAIEDGRLLYSLESEKDSFARNSHLTPTSFLEISEVLGAVPDVVALSGWQEKGLGVQGIIGDGYAGTEPGTWRETRFYGKPVTFFTSSHERSHIFGAIGMAPYAEAPLQAVLLWEGMSGKFFLVDDQYHIVRTIDVMHQPGAKYAALFAVCDPSIPDHGGYPRLSDAGKLMAIAAYGDVSLASNAIVDAVDRILRMEDAYPIQKSSFRDTPLYNCGPSSETGAIAAAVATKKIFEAFASVALKEIPAGIPLRISGGCGLNCDWNSQWAELGHFSSVFVPPCPNDSGSAIGTAIDALGTLTGIRHIEWDVYSGLEFAWDVVPDPNVWTESALDEQSLAESLDGGSIVAWVQSRWEIGPRALGNRSLLASPYSIESKHRLNSIKQRENYRPIAPCARIEDLHLAFDETFEDPFMLYFRRVRDRRLEAITHVDGTARVQTVSARTNAPLHRLLGAAAQQSGVGVLCNTSLNFNGHGFINRMSDLARYCETRDVDEMVVGQRRFRRRNSLN